MSFQNTDQGLVHVIEIKPRQQVLDPRSDQSLVRGTRERGAGLPRKSAGSRAGATWERFGRIATASAICEPA
jgi:hypothetical protein